MKKFLLEDFAIKAYFKNINMIALHYYMTAETTYFLMYKYSIEIDIYFWFWGEIWHGHFKMDY